MGQKEKTEGATGPGRIKKRADRKVDSNDNPEIPDRVGGGEGGGISIRRA